MTDKDRGEYFGRHVLPELEHARRELGGNLKITRKALPLLFCIFRSKEARDGVPPHPPLEAGGRRGGL